MWINYNPSFLADTLRSDCICRLINKALPVRKNINGRLMGENGEVQLIFYASKRIGPFQK
jgi:hypothetical protein